jgi:maleate isomerase
MICNTPLVVGRFDPGQLPDLAAKLDKRGVDAVVLSACVQMPSLPAVGVVPAQTGLPVVTAAVATSWRILRSLNLEPVATGGGALLS